MPRLELVMALRVEIAPALEVGDVGGRRGALRVAAT